MNKLIVYFDPPEPFVACLGIVANEFEIIICANRDELESHLPETEILFTWKDWPDAKMIRLASRLRWIQALSAGVDFLPLNEIKKQGIILTDGRGIRKLYVAEYAIASMINLDRN